MDLHTFFRIPPFPGAKVHAFDVRRGEPTIRDDAGTCMALVRSLKVGGAFWMASGNAEDRQAALGSEAAFDAAYLQDRIWLSPFTGEEVGLAAIIRQLGEWRALIDANRPIKAASGFAFWKQETVAPLLWGGEDSNLFDRDIGALSAGDEIATWSSRLPAGVEDVIAERGLKRIEVEDGFIRSTGLGANCVPPLSIIADERGIYFDPSVPSDLELLIAESECPPALCAQAEALRQLIVETGVSKYGRGSSGMIRPGGARRHVLVTGQVEDDRSVLTGGGDVHGNLDLLRRARACEPGAYIIYKPHPDVEAGHRKGRIADGDALSFADQIVRDDAITGLLHMVDGVHVLTSLAGFEALIRGKDVTTHGVPFYAGWGLTTDLGPVPARRTRRVSLPELVAATLLLYPRYLDPVTGLPCPADILVRRLSEGSGPQNQALVTLRQWQGRLSAVWRTLKGQG